MLRSGMVRHRRLDEPYTADVKGEAYMDRWCVIGDSTNPTRLPLVWQGKESQPSTGRRCDEQGGTDHAIVSEDGSGIDEIWAEIPVPSQ
jgi:hypothetical protein